MPRSGPLVAGCAEAWDNRSARKATGCLDDGWPAQPARPRHADHRCEIAAFVHHTSNAKIKLPNSGLTYGGILLRVALP